MNKEGTIIILDADEAHCALLCTAISESVHTNKCVGFTSSEDAALYLHKNIHNVFILLQNTDSPAVVIPNTRNMVYLHEKFDTNKLPYMLLMLTVPQAAHEVQHKYVHCYYRTHAPEETAKTLLHVLSFWKDQVFPPKVRKFV